MAIALLMAEANKPWCLNYITLLAVTMCISMLNRAKTCMALLENTQLGSSIKFQLACSFQVKFSTRLPNIIQPKNHEAVVKGHLLWSLPIRDLGELGGALRDFPGSSDFSHPHNFRSSYHHHKTSQVVHFSSCI